MVLRPEARRSGARAFRICIAHAAKPIPDEATDELCSIIGRLESLDDISDIIFLLS